MTKKVRLLSKADIERSTERLLKEYQLACGQALTLPIPVEEILETHLKLTLDFDDLHEKLFIPRSGPEPEILGALWADTREVFIDQSLDPEENPHLEGRYRFSLGHEIGHWQLHREYLTPRKKQPSLIDMADEPNVVCRKSEAGSPMEWQADYFASTLLMPKTFIFAEWHRLTSGYDPIVYEGGKRLHGEDHPRPGMMLGSGPLSSLMFDGIAKRLSPMFKVSVQAMRIRLEKLGLLCREVPAQRRIAGVG